MNFQLSTFDNPRMNNAFMRYQEAFGTTKEIGLFGVKITGKTAEIFEKLVDNAILSRTRLTEDQLAEMYNDVPFPGEDVVY